MDYDNSERRLDGTMHMDYDSVKKQNSTRHRESDGSSRRHNNTRNMDLEHSIRRQNGGSYNEPYARNNPISHNKRQYGFSPNNRQYDYRRNVNSRYLHYSIFDFKRQAHLLKVMNWCSDNFANFMDDTKALVNYFTMFTVINANSEGGDQIYS